MSSFAYIRDLNPQVDDLPTILRVVHRYEGDNERIARAIFRLFSRTGERKGFSIHSIKANTMTSLREENLGVMTSEGRLTPFGKRLLRFLDDEDAFKKSIAKHLILEKGGLFLCRGLMLIARSKGGYREQLATMLSEKYGLEFWRDLNNISSMHSFLEWAGVCKNYRLDEARLREVIEVEESAISGAEKLSPEALALLEALVYSIWDPARQTEAALVLKTVC